MSVHFITILGTSLYTNCTYEIEGTDFEYNTPFAQMATLKYIEFAYGKCDRITVFVTEKSRKKNWITREYTKDEREMLERRKIEVKENEVKVGLKDMMATAFPDAEIESVEIREGRNKEEIDDIFESMYDAIMPDETIYFDFTHGLRNIPMQALTVIHYAKILKNIQVGGIYYGAFELGEKKEDGFLHVNLLDMSACSTILDWTSAAESFIKSGSSNQIGTLYKGTVKQGKKESTNRRTLDRLCDLTNCLNTSRGKSEGNNKNSIRTAYNFFKLNYSEMRKSENSISERPLRRLFDRIEENVKIFDRECFLYKDGRKVKLENTATGMAAVEWAIGKGLTQQGFTALEETIKTYVCESYEIPAEEELVRDIIVGSTVKFMATRYNNAKTKQEKLCEGENVQLNTKELKEDRRKELQRDSLFMKMEAQKREFYIQKVEEMMDKLPVELVHLTSDVTRFRNTLNHFGFQKDGMGYDKIQGSLEKFYNKMKEIMEKEQVMWE